MDGPICDMHVHTHFSCDSTATMTDYCQAAIRRGVRALCFTDHVDNNKNDHGCGYYDAQGFFGAFEAARDRYGHQVELLCGIEFSEPHLYPKQFEALGALPYDFILGSVHFWYEDMFASQMVKQGIALDLCWERYWQAVLKAVQFGGFDCLAHMDFPKRYYGQMLYAQEKVEEICKTMHKNGIGLEINTSSLRKGLPQPMPGAALLHIYRACGGEWVTLGSDAHQPEDLGADLDAAHALARSNGLAQAIFRRRKRVAL